MNKPYRIIQAFNNLVVKNKDGREVNLKRGGLNNFLPLKKKGGLLERGRGLFERGAE